MSKLAGENYCRAFTQVYGLETVCLRYLNSLAPGRTRPSQYAAMAPKFVMAMLDGRRPVIYGDGTQSRDFTYVANVVECNLLACRADGIAGEVFNVACGERFMLLELVEQLEQVMEKRGRTSPGVLTKVCPTPTSLYLVTGGAGFSGSNIVERLVQQGRPRSIADPLTTHQVNATGTLNVLLAGVKRLVYAFSSSVYGDSPELPSGRIDDGNLAVFLKSGSLGFRVVKLRNLPRINTKNKKLVKIRVIRGKKLTAW